MKQFWVMIIVVVFLGAGRSHAQTAEPLEIPLADVPPPPPLALPLVEESAVPETGTFYTAQLYEAQPPYPFNPLAEFGLPIYSLGTSLFLIDDRTVDYVAWEQEKLAMEMAAAAAKGESLAGKGSRVGEVLLAREGYPPESLSLELDAASLTNGAATLVIYNPESLTNNPVWDVFATTNLSALAEGWSATNWTWLVRTGPGETNVTVPMLSEWECYYRLAGTNDADADGLTDVFETLASHSDPDNADTDGDGMTDGWEWNYFGSFEQTATDDYDSDGASNLTEFNAGTDPNTIAFAANGGFGHVAVTNPPATITVLDGVPSELALLVDATNFTSPNWQPFAANPAIPLPDADGEHQVWVALRGRVPAASLEWLGFVMVLDRAAPSITITNPTSGVTGKPIVQVQGWAGENLSAVSCTVSNAAGVNTNVQALVTGQAFGAAVTNYFQCFDVELTNGVNDLTVRVMDLAGNTTTTNLSLTFDTAGDTNAPVLAVLWPQDGAKLGSDIFTLRARVDDETATVELQISSTNGVTNLYAGIVERNGAVWVEDIALTAGTNWLALTATDAAGNTSMTNLMLIRSAVNLAIQTPGGLNDPFVNVSGTISDGSYMVWVNGVQATVNGTNWFAVNVPLAVGGSATISVNACQSCTNSGGGGEGSGGNGDPSENNPSDPDAITSSIQPEKPVELKLVNGEWSTHYLETSALGGFYASEANWRWDEAAGGYAERTVTEPFYDEEISGGLRYWITPGGSERFEVWQGTPDNVTYTNWVDLLEWFWHGFSVQGPPADGRWTHHGESEYGSSDETWSAQNVNMQLRTGGRSGLKRKNLIGIAATVVEKLAVGGREIPGSEIVIPGFGNPDAGGFAYAAIADNTTATVTPQAPGGYKEFIEWAGKYKLQILFRGKDVTEKTTTVWAGEQMGLEFQVDPEPPTAYVLSNIQWTVEGPAYANIIYTSTNGIAPPLTNTTNSGVAYYWAKEFAKAKVTCSAFVGGKPYTGSAYFEVRKPEVAWTLTPKHPVALTNRCDGVGSGLLCGRGKTCGTNQVGMYFDFKVLNWKGYRGSMHLELVQLISAKERENFASNTNLSRGIEAPFVYDTHYPNESWTAYQYVDETGFYTDSPGVLLDGRAAYLSHEDSLQAYLLFTPAGGKPVPLKLGEWSWSGQARLQTNSATYELVTAPSNPQAATGQPCDAPPTWTNNIIVLMEDNSPYWNTNNFWYPVP